MVTFLGSVYYATFVMVIHLAALVLQTCVAICVHAFFKHNCLLVSLSLAPEIYGKHCDN